MRPAVLVGELVLMIFLRASVITERAVRRMGDGAALTWLGAEFMKLSESLTDDPTQPSAALHENFQTQARQNERL